MEKFDYIDYVEEQIELFQKYSKLYDDYLQEVNGNQINNALAHYSGVNSTLNAEYQRKKKQLNDTIREYQEWFDNKFMGVKDKVHGGKPSSFKASQKEIEIQLRYENSKEYKEYQQVISDLEHSTAFLRRLLEQWKRHGDMIIALSQNMRSEMKSFGLENIVNSREKLPQRFENAPVRKRTI